MSTEEKKLVKRSLLISFIIQRVSEVEWGSSQIDFQFDEATMQKKPSERYKIVRETIAKMWGAPVDDVAIMNIVNLDQVLV